MPRAPGPSRLDYNRVLLRIEGLIAPLTARLEQIADRQDERMGRMENDVARGRLEQHSIRTDLAEARNDTGELRDVVADLRREIAATRSAPLEAAAHGAARGVGEALAPAFAAGLRRPLASWKGWAVAAGAVGGIATGVVEFANHLPAFARVAVAVLRSLGAIQ